jgi:hypothetical protein
MRSPFFAEVFLVLLYNLGNTAVPKIAPANVEPVINASSIRYSAPLFYQFK